MIIDVQKLRAALKLVGASVDRKPSTPVLGCVLLTGGDGYLTLETTDKVLTTRTRIEAVDAAGFAVAVDHATFASVIGKAPNGVANVTVTPKGKVLVKAGGAEWNVMAQAAEEYPASPQMQDVAARIAMKAEAFAAMLASVAPSVAGEGNRYGLSGALVELHPTRGTIRVVATDGNRLNYFEAAAEYDRDARISRKHIVPRAAIAAMTAASDSGDVVLDLAERACRLTVGDTVVGCRMLEADFPDYRQVLPNNRKARLVVDAGTLAEAIKRVAIMTGDAAQSTRMDIDPDGNIKLTTRKLDAGDATATLTGTYDGEAYTVGFNAAYMLDALASLGVASVRIDLGDGLSPILLRPKHGADEDCLCVVMPVRLD